MTVVAALSCVPLFLILAIAGVATGERKIGRHVVYGGSFIVALALIGIGLEQLDQPATSAVLPLGIPWLGAHFRLDRLAAFFLFVINLGAAGASFYALGYGRHEQAPARVLPFYPAFLAGMNLVVLAEDAFTFLLAWEFMSLSSWALVVAHHRNPDNLHAGYVYLVMASFGTLCLLLAFGLLAGASGDYAFASMRQANPTPGIGALVLALTLLGAGSKAGLVPLHVWLPLAHPAAPTHVSALMSGVMTKVAVYAFIRILFDLVGASEWWWGMVVLGIAAATTFLGVLYALMQHDLKVLLAYHTVENIGIIFIGLGLALAYRSNGMDMAAALALSAALLHVLNHSLFKSLLFFGAGAVLNATGTRDMEELGGLIHSMPQTALTFLVGSVAISALPPLNGFVSEWLTLQAIFLSPNLPQWGLRLLIPATGAVLALSAALAAACFVKAFGITFLGRARGQAALQARETDACSLAAMFQLAILCVLLGLMPGFALDGIGGAVMALVHARMPEQSLMPWGAIVPINEGRSSYNGLALFLFIVCAASLTALAIHQLASRRTRFAPAWDCGTPSPSVFAQYSAGSFAQPIRRVFGTVVFRAREHVEMPPPGDVRPARFEVSLEDPPWEWIFLPIARAVSYAALRLNDLQFITIRRYLTLVFVTLIGLLLVIAIWE